MKTRTFIFLCMGFYALWFISRHGILYKERKTTEQTLIKAQSLIDQLKLGAEHADEVISSMQADYQVKTKDFPQLLQALHGLIITVRYGFIIVIGLVSVWFVAYVIKS